MTRAGRRETPLIKKADEKRDSVSRLRYPHIPSIPPLVRDILEYPGQPLLTSTVQVDVIDPQPGVTVREGGRSITGQLSQRGWLHSPSTKRTLIPPLPHHTTHNSKDSNNAVHETGEGIHLEPMIGVAREKADMYHRTLNVT